MTKLDKVINGLKKMLEESKYNDSVQYNPWADTETLEAAIALLNAQEPKLLHVTADINYSKIGKCPTCGKWINSGDYPNYCGHCGQAVKWE